MSKVKNNVNTNSIVVNNKSNSYSPLNAKVADTIGYVQDIFSSASFSVQDFVEENPAFAFKTIAEELKGNIVSGLYSSFSEMVDKLLLGAFRGVTLALDGWQFIKKLKEKNQILKQIEEKKLLDMGNLSEEDRTKLKDELNRLMRELDEKKIDVSISGGRVITDILGFVGAVAAAFSFPQLASAIPYLVAAGIVGDIVGVSYFAYKAIKRGAQNLSEKLRERREKEFRAAKENSL